MGGGIPENLILDLHDRYLTAGIEREKSRRLVLSVLPVDADVLVADPEHRAEHTHLEGVSGHFCHVELINRDLISMDLIFTAILVATA